MVCRRCRGLLVRETFDDLRIETDARDTATRCLNCGCIEDAIIRANRSSRSGRRRATPSGRVRKSDSAYIKMYSKAYASIR